MNSSNYFNEVANKWDDMREKACSVDYAMANIYLHHIENPLNGIKEMARILKPGGNCCSILAIKIKLYNKFKIKY